MLEKHNTALSKKSWMKCCILKTLRQQQVPCINSRERFRQVKRKKQFSCNFMQKKSKPG